LVFKYTLVGRIEKTNKKVIARKAPTNKLFADAFFRFSVVIKTTKSGSQESGCIINNRNGQNFLVSGEW